MWDALDDHVRAGGRIGCEIGQPPRTKRSKELEAKQTGIQIFSESTARKLKQTSDWLQSSVFCLQSSSLLSS